MNFLIYEKLPFYIPHTKGELISRMRKWKGWKQKDLSKMGYKQLLAIYIQERRKQFNN